MKIYETSSAPNPRRVRMFLAEKGLLDRVEFVQIDIQKGENLTPEYVAKNPMKKVPVLELDDGTHIAETMAICRYFEESYPDKPLLGSSAVEKAQIDQWLRWLDFYFMMPTGMCFQHTSGYFADRMNVFPEWGEECRDGVEKFFEFLNQHLEGRDYIYGDQLSAVDLNAFATIEFNKVNKIRVAAEQENLMAWYERMKARPSASV